MNLRTRRALRRSSSKHRCGASAPLGVADRRARSKGGARITSYNVCYTKLLREQDRAQTVNVALRVDLLIEDLFRRDVVRGAEDGAGRCQPPVAVESLGDAEVRQVGVS